VCLCLCASVFARDRVTVKHKVNYGFGNCAVHVQGRNKLESYLLVTTISVSSCSSSCFTKTLWSFLTRLH